MLPLEMARLGIAVPIMLPLEMAGVRIAVPIMLPLEISAFVCGALGVFMKLMRGKLMSKAQKHCEIRTLAGSY